MGRRFLLAGVTALFSCVEQVPASSTTAAESSALNIVPVVQERRTANHAVQEERSTIATAAQRARPAVVSVNVVRRQRTPQRSIFDFGLVPREYERMVQGVGSGFIISETGLVITNQHVTSGASEIIVTTIDGTDHPARLLGEDPLTDLAVLDIDGTNHPALELGASTDLEIGEWVVAIGNPYAYLLGDAEPTVTAGVVSATGRNLLPSQNQNGIYVGMIQTDAAINPGNSGGPLIDLNGRVVGVNSSIFSNTGGSVGIGFAIPVERALRVTRELAEHGAVRRAWVGVDLAADADLRQWKQTGGVTIDRVAPRSPADRAGLREGDVVTSALGRPMRTFLDWESVKLDVGPGDRIAIETLRSGRTSSTLLEVEPLPSTQAERVSVLDIELIRVTPQIQQERSLARDWGVMVTSISGQTARVTRLRDGDVIVQVNRQRITSPADLEDAFRTAASRGSAVQVFFERQGRILSSGFYVR